MKKKLFKLKTEGQEFANNFLIVVRNNFGNKILKYFLRHVSSPTSVSFCSYQSVHNPFLFFFLFLFNTQGHHLLSYSRLNVHCIVWLYSPWLKLTRLVDIVNASLSSFSHIHHWVSGHYCVFCTLDCPIFSFFVY